MNKGEVVGIGEREREGRERERERREDVCEMKT